MLKLIPILLLLLVSICLLGQHDNVRINEFMALNKSTLTDMNGQFSDWIELYNPTEDEIDLSGWSLSDDKDMPKKWIFLNILLHHRNI